MIAERLTLLKAERFAIKGTRAVDVAHRIGEESDVFDYWQVLRRLAFACGGDETLVTE